MTGRGGGKKMKKETLLKLSMMIFLMENQSIMPEADFKQKKKFLTFFFLLTIICPSQGEASRVKKNL